MNTYALIAGFVLVIGVGLLAVAFRAMRLPQPSGAAHVACRVSVVWGGFLVGAITTLAGIGMLIPPI